MSSSSSKSMNMNEKNKITGIDNIDIITNGTPRQLKSIINPNQIGSVIEPNGNVISEITPLIMIVNKYGKNAKDNYNALIEAGADPNKKINYYNNDRSAYDLAMLYRSEILS